MSEIIAKLVDGVQFVATGDGGHSIVMDPAPCALGGGHGFKPSQLLLAALAGCSGVDVVEILAKQRQKLTKLEIKVTGHQEDDPPWTFHTVEIEYRLRGKDLNEALVKRAIELSETKYCSVGATISGKAKIIHRYHIEEE